jgi:pilus assembly protein CpaF
MIENLLLNPEITEICIHGPHKVFVEKNGIMEICENPFAKKESFDRFFQELLLHIDKAVDRRHPFCDGTLPSGERVHICVPPISDEIIITIRKHSYESWDLDKLKSMGMIPKDLPLREWIKERKNLLICGPTGSGKTTLMKALLKACPSDERIITLEDTAELFPQSPQHICLKTRIDPENIVPNIDLSQLLRQSLRMRPDRIVVGEVRGEEATILLDALSTGHKGSFCTLHANHPRQALKRLESLVSRANPKWDLMAIRQLISDSIDALIICDKKNGLRRISQTAFISSIEEFGYLLDIQDHA